ncbi:hypothetical protein V8C26DRAFT_399024 [Trichoderma gracile]
MTCFMGFGVWFFYHEYQAWYKRRYALFCFFLLWAVQGGVETTNCVTAGSILQHIMGLLKREQHGTELGRTGRNGWKLG